MISCYCLHATSSIFLPDWFTHTTLIFLLRLCAKDILIFSLVGFDDLNTLPKVCLWTSLANTFICNIPRFFSSELSIHLNVLTITCQSLWFFSTNFISLRLQSDFSVPVIQMIWYVSSNFSCSPFTENLFQSLHKQHNLLYLTDILKQSVKITTTIWFSYYYYDWFMKV